jgi:VanZ family protein
MTLHPNRKGWLLTFWFITIAGVVVGSLLPGSEMRRLGSIVSRYDKVQHFLAYTAVVLWPNLLFEKESERRISVLAMVLLGIALEIAQLFVPGRAFEFGDMLADAAGAITGWALARAYRDSVLRRAWRSD